MGAIRCQLTSGQSYLGHTPMLDHWRNGNWPILLSSDNLMREAICGPCRLWRRVAGSARFLSILLCRLPDWDTAMEQGTWRKGWARSTDHVRFLSPETAIDLHSGVSVEMLLGISCGHQRHGGEWPSPAIADSLPDTSP